MDIAIVTGAETPLGLRIVETLNQQGCRVHGIGNNFSKVTYADPQFKAHPVDLTDLDSVSKAVGSILEEEKRLHILIHAIDVTPGTAFEKLPLGNLEAILKIGLLGPVMMTRMVLPNLLRFRGQLINVITANKHANPASAANALIEGGLREMNKAIFDQGRDAGLSVTNCVLRQNTELSGATVSDEVLKQNHIDLEDVARTIEYLIDPKSVNVPEEVILYPRLSPTAEAAQPEIAIPVDDYGAVALPPKEYCPPKKEKIPTAEKQQIERTIPYTDEEMEDKIAAAIEDFEANPHLYDAPDTTPAQKPKQQAGGSQQSGQSQEGQGKKKRRRRRGGRNRNKGNREDGQDQNAAAPEQGGEAQAESSPQDAAPKQSEGDQPKEARKDARKARRGGRGKRSEGGNESNNSERKQQDAPVQDKPAPQQQLELGGESVPAEKPAKKKAAKKKAAKKPTDKKSEAPAETSTPDAPVKKAAKKAAKKKTAAKKAAKKATKKAAKKKAAKKVAKPDAE